MAIDQGKLDHQFADHEARPEEALIRETLRLAAKQFAQTILDHIPPCADQSDAIRKVWEALLVAQACLGTGRRY